MATTSRFHVTFGLPIGPWKVLGTVALVVVDGIFLELVIMAGHCHIDSLDFQESNQIGILLVDRVPSYADSWISGEELCRSNTPHVLDKLLSGRIREGRDLDLLFRCLFRCLSRWIRRAPELSLIGYDGLVLGRIRLEVDCRVER